MATYDNQGFGLAFTGYLSNENKSKLSEDRYEIYVNDDFIGYKTLFNASDTLSDVDDFLKNQGIEDFQSKLDGDHYYIQANETVRVKDALHIYCQNR